MLREFYSTMKRDLRRVLVVISFFSLASALGAELPEFDFTQTTDVQGWEPAHHIRQIKPVQDGLLVEIGGNDPYLYGPPRDYPVGVGLWLKVRLKSDEGGACQVFYFREDASPREENSVRFSVPRGQWIESRVLLPPLGPRYRLRIDPPGQSGFFVLAAVRFEARLEIATPRWPRPVRPQVVSTDPSVTSGDLKVVHGREGLGAFELSVRDKVMAIGNARALIGYLMDNQSRWIEWAEAVPRFEMIEGGFQVEATRADPDGAEWRIRQQFKPGKEPGAILVETRVSSSQDRWVTHIPMVTLFAGLGTFGTNKTQALFSGVEYLENEPSSSEADLRGRASKRQVPDQMKVTIPLISIAAEGRYVGLSWETHHDWAGFFDSPDRLFYSGGHVMGVVFPGSDGTNRDESSLVPYSGRLLRAGETLHLRSTVLGGIGESIIPSVEAWVRLNGLPEAPSPGMSAYEYFRLAARGWLDSRIREGDHYRHAVWSGFGAQPAADAALWMDWLAGRVGAEDLAARLNSAARGAIRQVPSANYNHAAVGHVRYPAMALIYGGVRQAAEAAMAQGRELLSRFEADGTVRYQKRRNGEDYGKTHFAPHANGLTAQVVLTLLETAVFSGDRYLVDRALRQLEALDQYRNGVPRGAQTWEIALHTPDILASAHLVRAYALGYELTSERRYLDAAKYWAWTGVPFVYLIPPVSEPIGLYSTIPVLGATSWVAPIWIGLPVQWCGLVYAEALYQLAVHDSAGPWKRIADGIAVVGMKMTWPASDSQRLGLLPDIFELRGQRRDGPAINPATVLGPAIRYWGAAPIYNFRYYRGYFVHVPGAIRIADEERGGIKFAVESWSPEPFQVLVAGVEKAPEVRINGVMVAKDSPSVEYVAERGWVIIQLRGHSTVELIEKVKRF